MKPSEDYPRMSNALEAAENAFWDVVADAYPEATTGDLSPSAAIKFSEVTETVVTEWLEINADNVEPDWRTTTILLHTIEYIHEDVVLPATDEEHIAYSITQGISEGELVDTFSERIGYWRIAK